MQLVPTQEDVIEILRKTGGLQKGRVEPVGMWGDTFVEVAATMRYYQYARILSVGLTRKLRTNTELRAMISELSIVAPATGGLPVAYGICEALRAKQVYWAERENETEPQRFRPGLEPHPGEKILLVDDVLRTGKKLTELKRMIEERGAEVVGLAIIVWQPSPNCPDFAPLPLYYLAKLENSD